MKLLSMVTALHPEMSSNLRGDHHGVSYLVEALNLVITESSSNRVTTIPLNDKQVDLLCPMLKVLFNVTAQSDASSSSMGEEEIQFRRLATVLRDLMLCAAESSDRQLELQANVIILLTNIPTNCFTELVVAVHPAAIDTASNCSVFECNDVTALKVMVDFLEDRLEYVDVSVTMI